MFKLKDQRFEEKASAIVACIIITSLIAYLFYITLPKIVYYSSNAESVATIISIDDVDQEYCIVRFMYDNKYDQKNYDLKRKVKKSVGDVLRLKKIMRVSYPKYFPKYINIDEINESMNFALNFLGLIILSIALIPCLKPLL